MQIVKKAVVRKHVVKGRLYGRVSVILPGWLVNEEVMVVVWTNPTIQEATFRRKGTKLWKIDEKGNVVEVKPEPKPLPKAPKKRRKRVEREEESEEVGVEEFELEPVGEEREMERIRKTLDMLSKLRW
jgi:hypothetical protein